MFTFLLVLIGIGILIWAFGRVNRDIYELRDRVDFLLEERLRDRQAAAKTSQPSLVQSVTAAPRESRPAPVEGYVEVPHHPPQESVETKITGKWFAVVGIIAVLVGVAFFLKYAFENNLIGVTGRVMMGIAAGLVLLILGDFLSRKERYRDYSFFISGGGLSLLYLSLYAAFAFYHLISQQAAFSFMIVVTGLGAALALRLESERLAALALLGGFLTPFLVSTGTDNQMALMSYVLILNLGFLAMSSFKAWRVIYALNFLGTYAVFFSWYAAYYKPEKLALTESFLTAYFLIFLVAPFLTSVIKKRVSARDDLLLSTANAFAYFGVSYYLLAPDYEAWLGFFFAGWAAVYVAAAYVLQGANRDDRYGIFALGGLGLLLATLAAPIQLEARWITIAWALEGVILTWVGLTLPAKSIRLFAGGVLAVAVARLFLFDTGTPGMVNEFTPIINERFFAFFVVVASLALASYLLTKGHAAISTDEEVVPTVLHVGAHLIFVTALSLELSSYFDRLSFEAEASARAPSVFSPRGASGRSLQIRSIENQFNLSLSLLWGLYAALLMVLGFVYRSRVLRLLGLAGLGVVILKVFLYDGRALSDLYRIASFIALGVILLVISFLFYRYRDKIKELILT